MPKKSKKPKVKKDMKDLGPSDMDLDEIAQACKEIDEEIKNKENRLKKKRSRNEEDDEPHGHSLDHQANKIQRLSMVDLSKEKNVAEKERLDKLIKSSSKILIEHLNQFGACVIDNFIGDSCGSQILEEVLKLKHFKDGQLASGQGDKVSIRSDKITWTDGVSPPSPALQKLITMVDSIILTANKAPNNGELNNYRLSGRTKAMVACYPGSGTHYVKHIDNPNRDGRCITAIYYLNKDWEDETDGGALRIHSKCVDGVVAQISPIFDRMIFFWSDRRNPHEVLPAYKQRYAVTLWYMDEDERQKYEESLVDKL